MFYTFNQNNSGGRLIRNVNLDHYVIIQAANKRTALRIARKIGIYFDGVRKGIDCSCCGDRWSDYVTGTQVPTIYGEPVQGWVPLRVPRLNTIAIHFADGTVQYTMAKNTLEFPDMARDENCTLTV